MLPRAPSTLLILRHPTWSLDSLGCNGDGAASPAVGFYDELMIDLFSHMTKLRLALRRLAAFAIIMTDGGIGGSDASALQL